MHIEEATKMFWGVTLDGGKRYTQTVERSFHLSMAALEPAKGKGGADTIISVMIQHEKAEFMLCTLQQGKLYQQPLDLNFTEGEEVTFFLSNNKGVVHLSGFLVEDDQYADDDFDTSLLEPSSDEDDSDDNEVPSLIEADSDDEGQTVPAGKKRKNEKVKEAVKKKKIKMLEEDEDLEDDDDDEDEDEFADFLDDETMKDSDEDEDDEDGGEEDDDEILKPKKKQKKQKKIETPTKLGKGKQEQSVSDSCCGTSEVKKKKKKKKKNKNKEGNEQSNSTDSPKQQQQPKAKKQVLAGGVVSEEMKNGHGPVAQAGKMVHVYYTGKLQKSGQQFDSCTKGKPFRFRLGKGEVIKGWDAGVSGMKVGGKRKLTIPSQQGYGNQRQGPIPPGSTLVFEVELKSVS